MRVEQGMVICLVLGLAQLTYPCSSALAQFKGGGSSAGGSEAIAPDFRGKITYEGGYEGTMTTPARTSHRTDLGSLVGAAMSAKSEPYRGGTVYEVEYDGVQIKGTFREQGAFNGTGTFTGTRNGTTCQLINNVGIRMTAECGLTRYFARLNFTDNRGRTYNSVVEANRTNIVDYVERERLAALQARRDAEAATQVRQQLAANPSRATPSRTAGRAPPSDAIAYFDGLIAEDASSWMMNRYDRGSMRNMKIIATSNGGQTKVVYGDYTYNGGQAGWVKAQFNNGELSCIEFWDFSGQCRPLGRSPSQGMAAGFAGALALGMMSGDNGGSDQSDCNAACRNEREFYQVQKQQRQIETGIVE